jgi:glycosyltransferase involved in cell wall biosynthesis
LYTAADRPLWRQTAVTTVRLLGPRRFGYAPRLAGQLSAADLDLLHAHGLWMYPSIASLGWARKQRRPYIVSPHGMLDGWALHNSAWKKRIAAALFERRHLNGAACLHALTAAEAWSMRAFGLRNPICVIPSGVDLPAGPLQSRAETGAEPRTLLYLGRLHPKKNLEALLGAWSSLRSHPRARSWRLVIAGWDDGGHLARLRSLASDGVVFAGPRFGAEKAASFARASAFVLPSQSEGLPVAVLEAWAHGLPVLMTPQCNLPEGFAGGAALPVAAPTWTGIRDALDGLFSASDAELREMGARGRELVARRFCWSSVACEMRQVYEWVLGRGERPASVYAI